MRHRAEAEFLPGVFRAFDDEGRRVVVELVGVRPHPAVLRFLEDEGKGVVEFLVRAEPDELALAHVDLGFEVVGELAPGLGVEPVGGDHEIVVAGVSSGTLRLGLEAKIDAELARALLQQDEQRLAADAAEAVAGGHCPRAAVVDGDVVPIGEVGADRSGADGIVRARLSSVSSESTTPQPNVSSGRFRSITTISWSGFRSFIVIAK